MTRDRGDHQKKGETKQKIIEFIASSPSLVVEEPKIRDYLKEKHNIREPKNIKKLLKDLSEEKLITKTVERGFENKWSIENLIQLQGIVTEYNDLTKIFQKNDKIISMLIDKHFKRWKLYEECGNELANKVKNSQIYFDKQKFKEYLVISPCFFKMCLKTRAEFNNTFKKILQLTMTHNIKLLNLFTLKVNLYKYYDNILEICVHTDIINNEASEEAIEKVYIMKRNTEVVMPE